MAPQEPTLNRVLEIWHGRSPDRLRVTGFVSDEERDLYHVATDVCLSPYTWNELTASGAVTWGLTSGKPVVTSTIPCFDEINEAYDCLLTAAPGMVHELAWQIRRVAGSAALRQRLVQNAARWADDHSWAMTAQKYATQFEELAATAPLGSARAVETAPSAKAA